MRDRLLDVEKKSVLVIYGYSTVQLSRRGAVRYGAVLLLFTRRCRVFVWGGGEALFRVPSRPFPPHLPTLLSGLWSLFCF